MKIKVSQIPSEGLSLEEDIAPSLLDLDIETIKFLRPIKVKADIEKITNAVSVTLALNTSMHTICSRCLGECEVDFKRGLRLHYPVDSLEQDIDLNPDIREEVILNYPMKPLCRPDCKGLCPRCGENLNAGGCSCKSKGV
ncbi:MAG: DUF177 domain-containing protein [Candidatus Omnitrophica bacterium]|nr:DUF177 domain-containing protein [Candidatus Omnitrophota bacterium]MBU4346512.1 DUF177 domain-containing protein [Candidatus Omnitrophota bacterium]MBU4472926.1 DUF177 domain-containing protein [Candidatus Omnitrophota bacterium]MCG2706781.1 DUF177 domain-containing protein [Candidatus Omnitrophota bacterium]